MTNFSCTMVAVVLGSVCVCLCPALKIDAPTGLQTATRDSKAAIPVPWSLAEQAHNHTQQKCWECGNFHSVADLNVCLPKTSTKTHYLLGDSHASRMSGAWEFAASPEAHFHNVSGCACRGAFNGLNETFQQQVLAQFDMVLKQGDTVIFNEWWSEEQATAGCWSMAHFKARLQGLHEMTLSKGANLVVVADNTDFTGIFAEQITKQQALCHQTSFRAAVQEVLQGSSHVFVFDLLDYVCEGHTCSRFFPGTSTAWLSDDDHIGRPDLVQDDAKAFMRQHGLL